MITGIYGAAHVPVIGGNVITVGAAQAGYDILGTSLLGFFRPVGIRQQAAAKGYQIHISLRQNLFRHLRRSDGADQGNRYVKLFSGFLCPFQVRHGFFHVRGDAVDVGLENLIDTG